MIENGLGDRRMYSISTVLGHVFNNMNNKIHKRFDPYNQYELIEKKKTGPKRNENILVAIIGGAYGHTFEGLFIRKAILQGKDVHVLCCGKYLEYCEEIHEISNKKRVRCAMCKAQQEDFIQAFGGTCWQYGSMIHNEDEKEIERYIVSFFSTLHSKHFFREVEIDQILYTALQRYYLIADPVIKDDKVTRGFLHTVLSTLIVMDKLIKTLHPKYVLSSHGTYSTWGAVVEYCKAHKIYVITYGQNYNHCGIEFTYDDSYLTGVLNDKEDKWNQRELSEEQRVIVQRFLDERLGNHKSDRVAFDYNKNNKGNYTKDQLIDTLNIDKDKKIVGLFPNIPWDGQVTGESNVFPHFRDWLKKTIDYFALRDDVVLVIRSHPAEILIGDTAGRETTKTILNELYSSGLPKNVYLLGPRHQINSYTLGRNSDLGITYSSTITLELTYLHVPVILCGCPPFKDKNIAFDILSEENYIELLNRGIKGELVVDQERVERLFRYLHYFFFMRTMPQTLVDVHDTVPLRYLFNKEEELDSDPVFDEMFRCIDKKLEMDFSYFYK